MAAPLPNEIEWLAPIEPSTPPPPHDPALAAELKRYFGRNTPAFVARFAACPWSVRLMFGFMWPQFTRMSYQLGDLIFLVVSQDSSCRYCYGNARMYLRLTGYSESRIRKLETDLMQSDLAEPDRLALDFVRAMCRASPRPGGPELAALARAGVDDAVVAEVAAYAAYCVIGTRVSTLVATAPNPDMSGRWYSPAIRAVIALMSRGRRGAVPPEPMPAAALAGPLAPLFRRLDGIPIAALMARAIGEGLGSDILPLRTKLLLMAVIGRALRCPASEPALRPMLEAAGVSGAELDEVLARLYAPSLSPLEATLVPLARETARYEPVAIQRRIASLAVELPDPVVLEFIAITALANAIARMTVVLDVA